MNTAGIHERSETIDCLRCLAVLWVVEYHLSPIRIFDRGTFGVLLFFIISGYCIAFSANSSTSAWHFSARRIGRILPALVVCSFITVAVKSMWPAFVDPGRQNSWFDWLYPPFAIVTLNFLSLDYRPADGAYWSLQVEFQFYVLYAAILLLGMKNYAVQVVCAFALMISLSASPGSNSSYDFFPYFLAGMSVAAIASGDRRSGYIGLASAFSADLVFLIRGFHQPSLGIEPTRTVMLWAGTGAVWIAATFIPRGWFARALNPLAFVGLVSYPLYLLHQDIGLVIYHALGYRTAAIGIFAMTPLFVAAAAVVYFCVERPLIKPLTQLLATGRISRLPRTDKAVMQTAAP